MQRYAKKSILRVLWRPSWISSKYYLLHMKEKMEPYFFSSRSHSEPESVAKSILTNKKSEITNGPALGGQQQPRLSREGVDRVIFAQGPPKSSAIIITLSAAKR